MKLSSLKNRVTFSLRFTAPTCPKYKYILLQLIRKIVQRMLFENLKSVIFQIIFMIKLCVYEFMSLDYYYFFKTVLVQQTEITVSTDLSSFYMVNK